MANYPPRTGRTIRNQVDDCCDSLFPKLGMRLVVEIPPTGGGVVWFDPIGAFVPFRVSIEEDHVGTTVVDLTDMVDSIHPADGGKSMEHPLQIPTLLLLGLDCWFWATSSPREIISEGF